MSIFSRYCVLGAVFLGLSGCFGSGGGDGGKPQEQKVALVDPNISFQATEIATAADGLRVLAADKKPDNLDATLGNGTHKYLVDEAYDLEMTRRFDIPPSFEDAYVVETLEVAVVESDKQHYLHHNVQTNEVEISSTATPAPTQLVVGPAPLGIMFGSAGNLQANAFVSYTYGPRGQGSVLQRIDRLLDFFTVDTQIGRFQEGNNLIEVTDKNYFNVILHGITPKRQFRMGARSSGDTIFVYVRVPSDQPGAVTVFRFTLVKESTLGYPVVRFPMTDAQWKSRAYFLPQSQIPDLVDFAFIDPLRSQELRLVYVDLKGVLDLSTVQLDRDTRVRILDELQNQPELAFALTALTNTSQIMVGDITCREPLSCRAIGNAAVIANGAVLILNKDLLAQGEGIAGMLRTLVHADQALLQQAYSACYGNDDALNFQAQAQELKTIAKHQAAILSSLDQSVSRSLASTDQKKKRRPETGRGLREQVRKQEIKRYLKTVNRSIQSLEEDALDATTDVFLTAAAMRLAGLKSVAGAALGTQQFAGTTDMGVGDSKGDDPCSRSLEPTFERIRQVEAERVRLITRTTELPEYFLAQVDHSEFAYQLDLIPTATLPLIPISFNGKEIGKMSPLFNADTLGDQPYNGLRVAFAIRNEGYTFVQDASGRNQRVPRLSFVDQRENDLRNVVYAPRTLVFVMESTESIATALAWLSSTFPNLKIAELVFDTHGQNGTISIGEVTNSSWLRPENIAEKLGPLLTFPKTEPFNVFINSCLVALDGGILARALNYHMHGSLGSTVLSANENYKVSVREVHNFESQPGSAFTFQYTHGSLFVHQLQHRKEIISTNNTPTEPTPQMWTAEMWSWTQLSLTQGLWSWLTTLKTANAESSSAVPELDGSELVYVKKPIRFYSGERDTASPTRRLQSVDDASPPVPSVNPDRLLSIRPRARVHK